MFALFLFSTPFHLRVVHWESLISRSLSYLFLFPQTPNRNHSLSLFSTLCVPGMLKEEEVSQQNDEQHYHLIIWLFERLHNVFGSLPRRNTIVNRNNYFFFFFCKKTGQSFQRFIALIIYFLGTALIMKGWEHILISCFRFLNKGPSTSRLRFVLYWGLAQVEAFFLKKYIISLMEWINYCLIID